MKARCALLVLSFYSRGVLRTHESTLSGGAAVGHVGASTDSFRQDQDVESSRGRISD